MSPWRALRTWARSEALAGGPLTRSSLPLLLRAVTRVVGEHPGHVAARFGVGRHTVAGLDDCRLARVVGCERKRQVGPEHRDQVAQVTRAPAQVLARVPDVLDRVTLGGIGHELHQPGGALG